MDGHGVPTHTRAPIEGPSFERTPFNSQSESGGKESARGSTAALSEFQAAWGTSAIDNASRTMRAWGKLSIDEQKAALAGIPAFKEAMAKAKRTIPIAGWRYLEERKWEALASPAEVDGWVDVKRLTRDWWALLLHKLGRGEKVGGFVAYSLSNTTPVPCKREDMPSLDTIGQLKAYPSDGDVMTAWRPWLEAQGVRIPVCDSRWVFLPGERPPTSIHRPAARSAADASATGPSSEGAGASNSHRGHSPVRSDFGSLNSSLNSQTKKALAPFNQYRGLGRRTVR